MESADEDAAASVHSIH